MNKLEVIKERAVAKIKPELGTKIDQWPENPIGEIVETLIGTKEMKVSSGRDQDDNMKDNLMDLLIDTFLLNPGEGSEYVAQGDELEIAPEVLDQQPYIAGDVNYAVKLKNGKKEHEWSSRSRIPNKNVL